MESERAQLCALPCRLKKIVALRITFFTIKTCRSRSNFYLNVIYINTISLAFLYRVIFREMYIYLIINLDMYIYLIKDFMWHDTTMVSVFLSTHTELLKRFKRNKYLQNLYVFLFFVEIIFIFQTCGNYFHFSSV